MSETVIVEPDLYTHFGRRAELTHWDGVCVQCIIAGMASVHSVSLVG